MSVRLSVCLPPCISAVPTGPIFMTFDIEEFYKKSVEKYRICLKAGKNLVMTKICGND
jgi:hypothetical protein